MCLHWYDDYIITEFPSVKLGIILYKCVLCMMLPTSPTKCWLADKHKVASIICPLCLRFTMGPFSHKPITSKIYKGSFFIICPLNLRFIQGPFYHIFSMPQCEKRFFTCQNQGYFTLYIFAFILCKRSSGLCKRSSGLCIQYEEW